MKNFRMLTSQICLIVALSTAFFGNAFSWNARGHVLISQIAYDNLSANEKATVDQYTQILWDHLPVYLQQQLEDNYRGASNFAKISWLPDTWRKITLANIFKQFDAPLPVSLKPYSDHVTDQWHFIDYPYPDTHCQLIRSENVMSSLALLQKAWNETKDNRSRAVIMILVTHFMEDAHQPLHMISKVNRRCENDAGGNRYSVSIGRHGTTRLHKVWDSGVGFLNGRYNYENKAQRLQIEFPKSSFNQLINDEKPTDWLNEDKSYAKFIYSVRRNQHLTRSYYQRGQAIARHQITLAGYRLAFFYTSTLQQNTNATKELKAQP